VPEQGFNLYFTFTQTIGGLGIFLLGMIVMTQALHALAGGTMRNALMKFTRSPLSGAIVGTTSTAILQSSSATTVAAVGFVGAGLITFSQSLGIIFGANIGTTITGWLVVLLGFKLKLASIILPVIFVGVVLKLFAKDRLATLGFAIAGFGLIFVGISTMQQGMAGLEQWVTPENFPSDTWLGRIQLLLLGVLITLITQSSSAGVAAALTALFSGAINFNQAAVLVIGMDVGTTITALMATIGGSIGSKRTGVSHVIYNIFTAILALMLLTPFTVFLSYYFPGWLMDNAEMALVLFHTLFNTFGLCLILPFTQQFSRFIIHIVSAPVMLYTQTLDRTFLAEPSVALTAVIPTIKQQLIALLKYIKTLLHDSQHIYITDFSAMQLALDETHDFVDLIHLNQESKPEWQRLLALIHVLDHMQRLHERCAEAPRSEILSVKMPMLNHSLTELSTMTDSLIACLEKEQWPAALKLTTNLRKRLANQLEPIRDSLMTDIASGRLSVPEATEKIEALRWLQRVFNHINRISFHLKVL
jgi:phosphate:Na+ symporter